MNKRMRKIRQRANSLLSKTVIGIAFITLAILMAVSVILFFWFRTEMTREYRQLTLSSLSNTDVVFSHYIQNARNLVTGWYTSYEGVSCRLDKDYYMIENMGFVKDIQDDISSIPYIHSVYFLNSDKEISLMCGNGISYLSPLDDVLAERLSEQKGINKPFVWKAPNHFKNREDITLMTVYTWELPITADGFAGAALVNMDAGQLSKNLFAGVSQDNLKMFIMDEYGNIITHSDMGHYGENWGEQEFVRRILDQGPGTMQTSQDGHQWEINSMKSSQNGYYIVAQSEYIHGLKNVNGIANVVFLIILSAAVAIMVLTLTVFRRIFRPFHTMLEDMRQESAETEDSNPYDEVAFLHHYYSQMSERIQAMHKKEEKDFVVKNLLLGNQDAEIRSILISGGMLMREKGYYMVLACLSDEKEREMRSMQEYDMQRDIIRKIYGTALEQVGKCTYFEIGLRRMLFLTAQSGDSFTEENIMSILNKARDSAMELSHISVVTALSGGSADGESDISSVYRATEDKLRTKLILGDISISPAGCPEEGLPAEVRREILDAVKKREKEVFIAAIGKMLDICRQHPWGTVRSWLETIAEDILLIQEKVNVRGEEEEKRRKLIRQQAADLNSLEGICEWFDSLYEQAAVQLQKVNSHSAPALMEAAVDYIRNNYDDNTLSANMLADRLHISASYFGKLFREFAGCGVLEYITKIRMEKAHDMILAEPDKDIARIASAVGYSNNAYFATAFKKFYGVSPSKLRDYKAAVETKE